MSLLTKTGLLAVQEKQEESEQESNDNNMELDGLGDEALYSETEDNSPMPGQHQEPTSSKRYESTSSKHYENTRDNSNRSYERKRKHSQPEPLEQQLEQSDHVY